MDMQDLLFRHHRLITALEHQHNSSRQRLASLEGTVSEHGRMIAELQGRWRRLALLGAMLTGGGATAISPELAIKIVGLLIP